MKDRRRTRLRGALLPRTLGLVHLEEVEAEVELHGQEEELEVDKYKMLLLGLAELLWDVPLSLRLPHHLPVHPLCLPFALMPRPTQAVP
jgi:hypothetical protein